MKSLPLSTSLPTLILAAALMIPGIGVADPGAEKAEAINRVVQTHKVVRDNAFDVLMHVVNGDKGRLQTYATLRACGENELASELGIGARRISDRVLALEDPEARKHEVAIDAAAQVALVSWAIGYEEAFLALFRGSPAEKEPLCAQTVEFARSLIERQETRSSLDE